MTRRSVLGIDAAWTLTGSTGVALVAETAPGAWRTVAVHGSYRDFVASAGTAVPDDFHRIPLALVQASRILTPDAALTAVVVDMPLSKLPITGRRPADNLISRAFGAAKCGTHSPSAVRPGPISAAMRDGFAAAGFPLATERVLARGLYETYPHPTLLHLMDETERYRYKVAKAAKLWPKVLPGDRWRAAVTAFQAIAGRLEQDISGAAFEWPDAPVPMSSLKVLEDRLDALICAWVGTRIIAGVVKPVGDADAAVWLPC